MSMESQRFTNTQMEDNFCSPENNDFYAGNHYKTLDNSNGETRFLALKLQVTDSNQSRLEVDILDKVPPSSLGFYFTVSYAAGNHKETEQILVNNSPFNAFRSLVKALWAVRDQAYFKGAATDEYIIIWADQICIDQSNPDERAYQVQHMREIYEKAYGTIIYLGEDTHDGRAIVFLQQIAAYLRDRTILLENDDYVSHLNRAAEWVVNYVENPVHAKDWMAVWEMLEASWWR